MQSPVVKGRDLRTVRGAARTVRPRAAAINADCRRPGAGGPQGSSEVHHLDRGERGAHRAVRPGRPVVVDRQIDVYATNVVVVPLVVPALERSVLKGHVVIEPCERQDRGDDYDRSGDWRAQRHCRPVSSRRPGHRAADDSISPSWMKAALPLVDYLTTPMGLASATWQDACNRSADALHLGAGPTPSEVRVLLLSSVHGRERGTRKIRAPANGTVLEHEAPIAGWAWRVLERDGAT